MNRTSDIFKMALIRLLKAGEDINKINVKDIAEESTYSCQTFYTYYQNKNDLIEAIIYDEFKILLDFLRNEKQTAEAIFTYIFKSKDLYHQLLNNPAFNSFKNQTLHYSNDYLELIELAILLTTINYWDSNAYNISIEDIVELYKAHKR